MELLFQNRKLVDRKRLIKPFPEKKFQIFEAKRILHRPENKPFPTQIQRRNRSTDPIPNPDFPKDNS